ncbi:MAG: AmmeMemoRadiSam system radical SAM enzyme [Treponema sp.]|jgi:pyruvate formate lyase activating enzyme|nr:AmmeMemoRadiSam system radical SAM enzyme [Treponema sp.]
MQKEALFYEKKGEAAQCVLCPRMCVIQEGETGFCSVRRNSGGILLAESYGRISSLNLDPIEKKPLNHFFPGSAILSVGGYGCNMACAFCQNFAISQMKPRTGFLPPEKLLEAASSIPENLGVAFTYNEPCINVEYILDVAPLLRKHDLKIALVTNGMILEKPLAALLPLIDAMNIDLKAFSREFYQKHGGSFETVKKTIETCAKSVHIEITTLIVPGENDGDAEMDALSEWLASVPSASGGIPLHITRFFPRFKMRDKPPTPVKTIFSLVELAKRRLRYVYAGNVN